MAKPQGLMLYVNDLLASFAVSQMDDQQFGWYMKMLLRAWHFEKIGHLPNDPEQLWVFAGAKSRSSFEKRSALVMSCWKVSEDKSTIYNDKLIEEFQKLTGKSEKARESAGKRWGNANAMPTHSERNATPDAKAMLPNHTNPNQPTNHPQTPVGDAGVNFARGTLERMGVGTGQLVMRECGDAIDRKARGVPGVIQGIGDLQRAAEFIAEAWKARPPDDKRSVLTWLQNNGFEKHKPKASPPIGKPMGAK